MAVTKALTLIRGRYRLESLVGEGGMASVWKAKDLTLARPVAVKLLFARDERDHELLVQRFLREARIAAAVQHRNVIHIVDFGTTEEGQPFMVMELLEGESLGERLHRERTLSIADTVHIASMTLRGLGAVHDAGIIHRDLKPDNIYLKVEGGVVYPKILDFGISRSVEPTSGRRSALTTREGIIVGTPEYMSPEQARGIKQIDRRTDIYSMGVILHQALTGVLPFHSENVGDLIIQIVTSPTPRAIDVNPDIPEALSDVISRAMARNPDDRFADAAEMQRAMIAAAETSIGETLRRTLSDMPPLLHGAVEGLPVVPRDRPPPSDGQARGDVPEVRDSTDTLERFNPLPEEDADPVAVAVEPAPEPLPHTGKTLSTDDFLAPYKPKPSSRRPWMIGVVSLAALAAGVWLWPSSEEVSVRSTPAKPALTQPAKPAAEAPVAAEPAVTATETAAETATETEPSTITITLENVPGDATVTLDGKTILGDRIVLAKDDAPHVLMARARGKVWQTELRAESDQTFQIALVDEPRPTSKPAAPVVKPKKPQERKPSGTGALRDLDF